MVGIMQKQEWLSVIEWMDESMSWSVGHYQNEAVLNMTKVMKYSGSLN